MDTGLELLLSLTGKAWMILKDWGLLVYFLGYQRVILYPTPMTISTSIYHTGLNPLNDREVDVPKSTWERKAQRALLQYRSRNNYKLVREALEKCGRTDLIGSSPKALSKFSTSSVTRKSRQKKKSNRTGKGQ